MFRLWNRGFSGCIREPLYCMIGFHCGMFGPLRSSGPFSQSVNAAMAGPWLNSSSVHRGRSASPAGVMRDQKALRMEPRLLRLSGSMPSSVSMVATIQDPWPTISSVVGTMFSRCRSRMSSTARLPRCPVWVRLSTPWLSSPPVCERHES